MRIIVWGINYAPELTGIAPYNVALCEFLRARGHAVEMLTTFSYYPTWRKRREDRRQFFRTDFLNGVPVHRCWHFVPARVSALKRILHEATFVFTSTVRALALPAADVYVVVSPPLLLGAAAWLVTRIKNAPFVFHVQDLQPDAAVGLGMLKPSLFTRALYRLEAFAYSSAARVSGISQGMLEAFRRKNVSPAKLIYFPNGVRLPVPETFPQRGAFREKHGFAADEFLAIYSGNLGVKQGLDVLIEAARLLAETKVRIVICGDGAQREALARRAQELQLPNVAMLPLQPLEDYASMLVDSDVCLVTQQAGSGAAFFPSKLLNTLAYARPVLTVADEESQLARALEEGGFGINVRPGAPEQLAGVLHRLTSDPARSEQYGRAGRNWVEQFEEARVLENFARELEAI